MCNLQQTRDNLTLILSIIWHQDLWGAFDWRYGFFFFRQTWQDELLHYWCPGFSLVLFRTHTKVIFSPVSMEVDPQFPIDIVLHTGVLLIMESIQGTTDHRVNLKSHDTRYGRINKWDKMQFLTYSAWAGGSLWDLVSCSFGQLSLGKKTQ